MRLWLGHRLLRLAAEELRESVSLVGRIGTDTYIDCRLVYATRHEVCAKVVCCVRIFSLSNYRSNVPYRIAVFKRVSYSSREMLMKLGSVELL